MDFLAYLLPQNLEIYRLVARRVRVNENAPICRKHAIYGWFHVPNRTMTVCTQRILANEGARGYINETLLHEAAHVAQACKMNMRGVGVFGLPQVSTPLSDRRQQDLRAAAKLLGRAIHPIEREAFWMEDKPNEVLHVLRKYCF